MGGVGAGVSRALGNGGLLLCVLNLLRVVCICMDGVFNIYPLLFRLRGSSHVILIGPASCSSYIMSCSDRCHFSFCTHIIPLPLTPTPFSTSLPQNYMFAEMRYLPFPNHITPPEPPFPLHSPNPATNFRPIEPPSASPKASTSSTTSTPSPPPPRKNPPCPPSARSKAPRCCNSNRKRASAN